MRRYAWNWTERKNERKKYAVFETLASCLQCFVLAEAGHFSTLSWALTESKVRSMTYNFWQSNEKIETHKIPVSFYFGEPQDIVACFCSFLLQVDEVKKNIFESTCQRRSSFFCRPIHRYFYYLFHFFLHYVRWFRPSFHMRFYFRIFLWIFFWS